MTTANRIMFLGLAVMAAALWLAGPAAAADDLDKQALELNDITGDKPIQAKIKELLGKPKEARNLIKAAMPLAKDKKFNYNAAFILARVAQELREIEKGETFYRICSDKATKLRSGQKMVQSFGGLIDMYYENKMYDKTAKVCQEFMELQGDETVMSLKPAVMERLIQSMARQGKFDAALKLVDPRVELEAKEDGWWWLQLKASVLREANKLQDAADAYKTVVERIEKDKRIKDDTKERYLERNRYYLSGVYVDLKDIDKATEILQALLKAKPDNSTFNNDLGYIWADNDRNLDEAEKLIRKALELDREQRKKNPNLLPEDDRDNGAYLDSLGWVLYKQKKYKEAKKYLLQAVEDKDSQHIEIFDHLADVYLALNEKDKAIATWKKGIEVCGPGKREQDRKVKVEAKIKKYSK